MSIRDLKVQTWSTPWFFCWKSPCSTFEKTFQWLAIKNFNTEQHYLFNFVVPGTGTHCSFNNFSSVWYWINGTNATKFMSSCLLNKITHVAIWNINKLSSTFSLLLLTIKCIIFSGCQQILYNIPATFCSTMTSTIHGCSFFHFSGSYLAFYFLFWS